MKCESCPNRPCDGKKAACDNCLQRLRKQKLLEDISDYLKRSIVGRPLKDDCAVTRSDEECIRELRKAEEEKFAELKRRDAHRERNEMLKEERGWSKCV